MGKTRQQLIFQLENQFDGSPWYGLSMMESLDAITPEQAQRRQGEKSIIGLTLHLLAWRSFVLEKLRGNDDYDIDVDAYADWPDPDVHTWPEVLSVLRHNQSDLMAALSEFPPEKFQEIVPGRGYTYAHMVDGVVQHDIYHLGQVNLLAAAWRQGEAD